MACVEQCQPERSEVLTVAAQMCKQIASHTYRFGDEDQLQQGIAEVLVAHGINAQREHALDERRRLDIWMPDQRIALEVKVDGTLSQALRQVNRYAGHPDVACVILVTSQRWGEGRVGANLQLHGKPVEIFRIRRKML